MTLEGRDNRGTRLSGGLFLPAPPAKLNAPPARLRPLITALWIGCLMLAILIQGGATWRLYVYQTVTAPSFAALGLVATNVDAEAWRASARPPSPARKAGMRRSEIIERIDGVAVDRSRSASEIAQLLRAENGQEVTLTLAPQTTASGKTRPRREVRLVRSDTERKRIFTADNRAFRIVSHGVDLLIAILLLVVATLLKWRRPKDPVAVLLSFALLFLATQGTWRLWEWLRAESVPIYLNVVWLSLLLVALPALPNGRYVPAWSRWFMLLGPAGALLLAFNRNETSKLDSFAEVAVMGAIAIAVVASIVLRFLRTRPGTERQKMKWAALGFGVGVLLAYFGGDVAALLPRELEPAERYLEFAVTRLGFIMMPFGLLFSLLGYRLNDVDAAIGRSAVYATATTLAGVVLAVGTHYSNQFIDNAAGRHSEGLAIALSTIVALALFAPAKRRMMGWIETRFQGALLRLRSLPERIARWQEDDDPEMVAQRALAGIAEGVGASAAALLRGSENETPEILAVHKVTRDKVSEHLGHPHALKRRRSFFPLRIATQNQAGAPLILLIGRRKDRAFYGREERAAVTAIAEPLADALRLVSRRAAYNAALAQSLAEISERLQQIGKKRTRRKLQQAVENLTTDR